MALFFGIIVNGQWQPGIGDPTFRGWFTVIIYLLTALLAGFYAMRPNLKASTNEILRYSLLWWGIATLLLLLGVNKQLDLQTWLTTFGRELAKDQGWYQMRRYVQVFFIGFLALFSLLTFFAIAYFFRKELQNHKLALFGLAFLLGFIVMRAASFHHLDSILRINFFGFGLSWFLEVGGILAIAFAILKALKEKKEA